MHPEAPRLDCAQAEALFSPFLDSDLQEADQEALKEHLKACAACRRGFHGLEKAMDALNDYEAPSVPRTFLDGVHRSTPALALPQPRAWPLRLAWSTAAAAVVMACAAWFTRPEAMRIEVPVEIERIVERDRIVEKERIVERRIPMPYAVEVPGRTPVQWVLDFEPLARALQGASLMMGEVALTMVSLPRPAEDAPAMEGSAKDSTQRPSDLLSGSTEEGMERPSRLALPEPAPPVALIWEENGALVLETSGPDHQVIPELLSLLEYRNPQITAVARERLHTIQERLSLNHGIEAPPDSEPVQAAAGSLATIQKFFDEEEEIDPRKYTPVERWQQWWSQNREPILCLNRFDFTDY